VIRGNGIYGRWDFIMVLGVYVLSIYNVHYNISIMFLRVECRLILRPRCMHGSCPPSRLDTQCGCLPSCPPARNSASRSLRRVPGSSRTPYVFSSSPSCLDAVMHLFPNPTKFRPYRLFKPQNPQTPPSTFASPPGVKPPSRKHLLTLSAISPGKSIPPVPIAFILSIVLNLLSSGTSHTVFCSFDSSAQALRMEATSAEEKPLPRTIARGMG